MSCLISKGEDPLQVEEDCLAMQYAIFFNKLPPYPGAYARQGGGDRSHLLTTSYVDPGRRGYGPRAD